MENSNQLYLGVEYFGENVCVAIACDLREKCIECYVGKVVDGQLNVNRKEGGYWAPLEVYITERLNRQVPVVKVNRESEKFPELVRLKKIIELVGEPLLSDSSDAFFRKDYKSP